MPESELKHVRLRHHLNAYKTPRFMVYLIPRPRVGKMGGSLVPRDVGELGLKRRARHMGSAALWVSTFERTAMLRSGSALNCRLRGFSASRSASYPPSPGGSWFLTIILNAYKTNALVTGRESKLLQL